jgi:hypothetical protein
VSQTSPAEFSPAPPRYANWWSKLLFKKKFEQQFFVPLPPKPSEVKLMTQLEKFLLRSAKPETVAIEKPIFIVGLPRSGTTLLFHLLCAHERAAYVTNAINAMPDAPYAIEWARKKFRWDVVGERFLQDSIEVGFGSPSEPQTFWRHWTGRDPHSNFWPEQTLADLGPERVARMRNDIRKILLSFGGDGRRFICKFPVLQTELRLLQQLFPDAKFIHILRDPRPAANSLVKLYRLTQAQLAKIKHPEYTHLVPYPRVHGLQSYLDEFGPESLECTARVWVESVELVRATARELKHFYEFKYEDLVAAPQAELEKNFRFCELDWPLPNNANFQKEFRQIGQVRHRNTYGDFAVVEKIAAPLMRELGYLSKV